MASRRHPAELEEREDLAPRFGLVLRRDAAELARRERTGRATAAALAVPYYALLHHGNVVRQALAQRGRLDGVVAVRLPGPGAGAAEVTGCAELIARVLMAEHEAHGAVYSIRAERWDATTGEGLLRIDAASAAGGETDVQIADGDLDLAPLKSVPDWYVDLP